MPFLGRVCALAVSVAGVDGAGITVMGSVADGIAGHRAQVCAVGAVSRRLEDLQLTAGQGPCLEAYATGAPVLVPELAVESRWPGFAADAIVAGAGAVFSFPLQVGAVRLGSFDLYRATTGALAPGELADALVLAGLGTETLLERIGDLALTDPDTAGLDVDVAGLDSVGAADVGWLPEVHPGVHQASGMTAVAASIGVGEALVRIRAYAFAHSEPIGEVARRIIVRDLVLDDELG